MSSCRRRSSLILEQRLSRQFVALVAAILAVVTTVNAVGLHSSLSSESEHGLEVIAEQQLQSIESRLDLLDSRMRQLATSTLTLTALVDSGVRDRTLPTLVRDFARTTEVRRAIVVDYRGRPIAGHPDSELPPPSETLVQRSIETDQPLAAIVEQAGRIDRVIPIRLRGEPQGAVYAQFELADALTPSATNDEEIHFKVSTGERELTQDGFFDDTAASTSTEAQSGGLAGELGLRLDLQQVGSRVFRDVLVSVLRATAIGLLLFALGYLWATRTARQIAHPIAGLCEEVRGDNDSVSSPGTGDELEELASAFNERTADLIEARRTLERRVEERTHDLQEAMVAVESASRAKSEFIANMSHEIRTPMTAILGYADVLTDDDLDEGKRTHAGSAILRNGQHLLAIVNDILDLSKIEAGGVQVEVTRAVPARVLEDVEDLMRVRAKDKGIELRFEVDPRAEATAMLDPTRVRQVLLNLVSNAIKFTSEGSVVVSMLVEGTAENARLCCSVTDTGIGLTREQADRLFQPFTQADSSTTRKYGGTGLGLYISHCLVELMDGSISVTSELGAGSTFEFDLPFVEAEELPEPESNPENERSSADLTGCRALVAEDGKDNQQLIRHFLERRGIEVEIRENGALAVEEIQRADEAGEPYDFVLMDMQMPVMSGYEAARELRDRGQTLPVIALTANAMSGDRTKSLDAGCSGFVAKPIDRIALFREIETQLGLDSVSSS